MKRMVLGYFLLIFIALVALLLLVSVGKPDLLYSMMSQGSVFAEWFAFLSTEPGSVRPIIVSAAVYWAPVFAAGALAIAIPLARMEYNRDQRGPD